MSTRPLLPVLLAAAGWLLPAVAPAQSASQRAALDAFRDSLLLVMDPAPLQQREAELMLAAKQSPNDPLLHLRQGFLALRLGDLGLVRHYDDAAAEFQWAVDLEPRWPYGWFALGLAEYELGEVQGPGSRRTTMLGRDAASRAASAYQRAALADPVFAARLEVLAAQAVRRRDTARAKVVLEALRRAVAAQPPGTRSPAILLATGRVEREVGDLPAALNAFETYRRLGDNRALGLLEVARTRFLLGQLEGAEPYYQGAAMDDLAALAAYRADLEGIAPDSVLAEFDLRRGQARADLLTDFWGTRDRLDLQPDGTRLREHYRRLAHARRHFSAGGWSLPSDPGFLRTEAELDDRGRLYVRHGEPDARATFSSVGVEPNESWHYRRPGGDLVFHFVARQAPDRYRLVGSLLDVVDMRGTMREAPAVPTGVAGAVSAQLLRSREGFASVYADLGPGREERRPRAEERERALVEGSLAIGLGSDSHEPRFARELAARLQAVATTSTPAGAVAHLQVAVPGFGLEAESREGRIEYPMRLRFVAVDGKGRVRAELDTILRPSAATPVRPDRYFQELVSVPVPAGTTLRYRMGLFVGAQGGSLSAIDTLHILAPDAGLLGMGDLVLGDPGGRAVVDGVSLAPMQSVSRSQGVRVHAEVAGLAGDGRYRAVLELHDPVTGERVFDHGFGGRLEGGRGVIAREVAMRGAPPGRYLARLTVTDQARGEVSRWQRIQVTIP